MRPIKNNITVRVDLAQKDEAMIGGNLLKTGRDYNENFRERNPVIAEVLQGDDQIPTGKFIVCNYNYFDWSSPFMVDENIFAIPVDEEIFAIVNEDGSLSPVRGNLLVERVTKKTIIDLPEDLKKPYDNRGVVLHGTDDFKNGLFVLWLRMADYEIVYSWNGEERRAIKVHQSEIVGYFNAD